MKLKTIFNFRFLLILILILLVIMIGIIWRRYRSKEDWTRSITRMIWEQQLNAQPTMVAKILTQLDDTFNELKTSLKIECVPLFNNDKFIISKQIKGDKFSLMEYNGFVSLANKFLELSYNSKKWDKWMLPNTKASDRDRSVIAGHYIFSTPECQELKSEVSQNLKKKGIELESFLRDKVKQSILRYLINFRLVRKI